MAEIDDGEVKGVVVDQINKRVSLLIYEKDGHKVYYSKSQSAESEAFNMEFDSELEWEENITFKEGDYITLDGYIFKCIRDHTSGTSQTTRNPSEKPNKTTWEVVGYTDEVPSYSTTVRYTAGFTIVYKDNVYVRTNYDLLAGQVPFAGSKYWQLIGPADSD